MTDTLPTRLRVIASKGVSVWGDLQMEAADRIEALQAYNDKLIEEGSNNLGLAKERNDLRSQVDSLNVGFNNCQKERDQLHAEVDRLTAQCRLFDAAAYKAKVEAQTLVEHAEARLTALEGQEPVAWMVYAKGSRRYFTLTFDVNKVPEIYVDGEALPLFLAAGAAPQQAEPAHLFELWWAAYMPDATQEQAFKAWSDAPKSKGVGVVQQAEPKEQT